MRLVYITTNIESSGGVQRVLSVKLNYLTEIYNYDVHLINTHGKIDELFYEFSPKITFYNLDQNNTGFRKLLRYQKQLKLLIKKIQPDIIINCDNGLKGALLPNIIGVKIPLIYEDHISQKAKNNSFLDNLKIKLQFFFNRKNATRYSKIIRFSKLDKELPTNNIALIPNPLPFNLPTQRASLNNNRIIALGRYSYEKAYERMLRMWKHILKIETNWILDIYGEGNNGPLIKLAEELGISNNVSFNPPIKNVQQELLNSSILINTSFFESFGLSLLEAMACGLPVISFDCEGPKIFIENSINGVLIPQDYEAEFIDNLLKLMNDIALRKSIGDAAKESVKVYEKQPILEQWHKLFQTIKSLN